MVSRAGLASAAALCLAALAARALDLTPDVRAEEYEGVPKTVMVFDADGREVRYDPPPDWEPSGSSSALKLRPPGTQDALATISVQPRPVDPTWGEASLQKLGEALLSTLPEGGRETATLSEPTVDAMRINGHPTALAAIEFTHVGERFRKSWLVCNFEKVQVRFEFVANTSEFPALYEPFRISIFSWNGLD